MREVLQKVTDALPGDTPVQKVVWVLVVGTVAVCHYVVSVLEKDADATLAEIQRVSDEVAEDMAKNRVTEPENGEQQAQA